MGMITRGLAVAWLALAAAATPPAPAPVAANDEVKAALEAWRSAWMARDLNKYMTFYDPSFKGQGLDRAGWQTKKAGIFKASADVKVTIGDLDIKVTGPDARTIFRQDYGSSIYADTGTKTLKFKRGGDGKWRIVSEEFADIAESPAAAAKPAVPTPAAKAPAVQATPATASAPPAAKLTPPAQAPATAPAAKPAPTAKPAATPETE